MVWAVPFQSVAVDTAIDGHVEAIYADFMVDYISKMTDLWKVGRWSADLSGNIVTNTTKTVTIA